MGNDGFDSDQEPKLYHRAGSLSVTVASRRGLGNGEGLPVVVGAETQEERYRLATPRMGLDA